MPASRRPNGARRSTNTSRGGGFSSRFLTEGGVPFTMTRVNIIKGLGPVLQIAEGWSVALPKAMHDQLDARTNSTWPTTLVCPTPDRQGPVQRCVLGDGQLGRQPRRADHRPRWRRFHYPRRHAAHSGLHAQRGRGENLSPFRLGRARHGYRGPGLPRLPELRAAV